MARIELARLDKKNAITTEMYVQLAEALAAADADSEVRAVLLHGAKDCFTAGNDLSDFLKRPPGAKSPSWRFFEVLPSLQKPIVAAVGGPAIGIGTTLLLHCDLVYATPETRFQLPFVGLGIVPEFGSTYLLPLLAGYQRAAELMLLGQPAVHRHQLQRRDAQALALEAGDDLAGQVPAEGVWLYQDEGSVHGDARSSCQFSVVSCQSAGAILTDN